MAYHVTLSPGAEEDILHLELYLSDRFYPRNVIRFVDRLTDACYKIGLVPQLGTQRDDLGEGVRVKGFERSVAIHWAIRGEEVRILGIAYRGRLPAYLE